MTRCESILSTVADMLAAVPDVTVFRDRQEALAREEGNAIIVTWDEDQPENRAGGGSLGLVMWNLEFMACVLTRADEAAHLSASQVADPIVGAIHGLLFADTTLGGLTASLIAGPKKLQLDDSDGTSAEVEMRFIARYQLTANSLTY